MMRLSAAVLAGISVAAIVRELGSRRRREHGARADGAEVLLAALAQVRRISPRAVAALARRDTASRIRQAGFDGRVAPRDIAAARAACVVCALALAPRLAAALPQRMWPLALAGLCFGAAELPLLWLMRRAESRSVAVGAAMPDALDLLRACVASGLPLRRSLALVAEHAQQPLAGEFAAASAEVALGVPLSAALERLAERNPGAEIRAFVRAVSQAERDGSPLAPVIAAQARDVRLAHNRAILERGARAGPKIQLIVSTTIVPGALGALAAVVIAAMASGRIEFL